MCLMSSFAGIKPNHRQSSAVSLEIVLEKIVWSWLLEFIVKMKWKSCFRVSLLSFCCLASVVSWTSAARTTGAMPAEETTTVETFGFQQRLEYPSTCYVERSKVRDLMTRMNQTVQILNGEDEFLQCRGKMEAVIVDSGDIEMCSEERILRIQKDLSEVAAKLFQLAIRPLEPSEEEIFSLDTKKFRLIDHLRALRVFYGPSPCDSSSIVLYPFGPLVEYVEHSLNQVLALFQRTRPTRPAPPTTTSTTSTSTVATTTPKPTEEDMLSPHASFAELTEMAQSNPNAMSRVLPRIVYQRYNEKASTLDKLLNFTESLPTMENQIFGVFGIHNEMYRYNRNPELEKLMKMAKTVERLNQSASTSTVDEAAISKLTDLIRDPDLNPINILQNPQASYKELTDLAYLNPTAMSESLPEIISQRYSGSASSFEDLLNFIKGLPRADDQIFGYSAVYDEILRYSQSQGALQILELVKTVKRLNETVRTSKDTSTSNSKLADLVYNLSPLIVIGEKAECRVTNVAYQLQLYAQDFGSPESAYLASYSDYRFQVYPKVKDGRLVFRISYYSVQHPFYSSDRNPNTDLRSTKYQTQRSERYVLWHRSKTPPSDAELDWKLVPIENKANQFKILSAKFEDFMFAHQSATAYSSRYRRVVLGRKSYSSHAHIPEADHWTFHCRPGTFTIPTN